MNYTELSGIATSQPWAAKYKETIDARNQTILAERIAAFDAIQGPRCGDWLQFPDGRMSRIAHHWGDGVQPSCGNGDTGSFYFGKGYASYSGSLDPSIPIERLTPTGKYKSGRVWFFSQDMHMAHNGAEFRVQFRVFKVA